jgi:hypothetical protein
MKKTKALRTTFISVGVLLAVGRLMAADASDGVLNSGNMPLGLPSITCDASDAGIQHPIPKPRPRPSLPRPRFPGLKGPDLQ